MFGGIHDSGEGEFFICLGCLGCYWPLFVAGLWQNTNWNDTWPVSVRFRFVFVLDGKGCLLFVQKRQFRYQIKETETLKCRLVLLRNVHLLTLLP